MVSELDGGVRMPITGNMIPDAVINYLAAEFPEVEYRYTESQVQNFKRPSFFVRQFWASQTPIINQGRGRINRSNRLQIRYFPPLDSLDIEAECNNMGNALMLAMQYIPADSYPFRARDLSYEVIDNTCDFRLSVDYHGEVKASGPIMETLEIDGTITVIGQ